MFAALSLLVATAGGVVFHGSQWQSLSASAKMNAVMDVLTQNNESIPWYSTLRIAELFVENMATSFTTEADDMPYQGPFDLEERPKLIHTVGAVATCKLVPSGKISKLYTGVLGTGGGGVIRFSTAAQPDPTATGNATAIIPGFALKIFRSGVASANIFAMYALTGQSSWNFFAHDLSNHPPNLGTAATEAQILLNAAFSKASDYPTYLGLSDTATYDVSGKTYTPKFPFRLVFHPTSAVHTLFPDDYTDGWTIAQLEALNPGTAVYDIYIETVPQWPINNTQILQNYWGSLVLTSAPTTSNFGDQNLFFQHTSFEEDLTFVSQWAAAAKNVRAQQATFPVYNYPDLPFTNSHSQKK